MSVLSRFAMQYMVVGSATQHRDVVLPIGDRMAPLDKLESAPLLGLGSRQRPSNTLAEQSLLGAILANNKALQYVESFLRPEHFYDPIHQGIYRAILEMTSDGMVADAITLKARLEHVGLLDEVGGTAYLVQLLTAMVGITTAGAYGKAVHEAWVRRQLIDVGAELVESAFAGGQALQDMARMAATAIDDAVIGAAERDGVSLDVAMDEAMTTLDHVLKNGVTGVSTGLPTLDAAIGGMDPGDMVVLAARPRMGKTALALQMGLSAARSGTPVQVFSLEMSRMALARRLLASATRIPVRAIRGGTTNQGDVNRLVEAVQSLRGLPILIDDVAGLTPTQIAARARVSRRRMGGLGLIITDHLHIVGSDQADLRFGNLTAQVGQNSTAMKRIAKDMDCPHLVLAQLNRGVETRDEKRPGMADLRQSGSIEQDADVIMFLHRPEVYLGKAEPEQRLNESPAAHAQRVEDWKTLKENSAGKAELILGKIRDGEETVIDLEWDGPTTSFREVQAP